MLHMHIFLSHSLNNAEVLITPCFSVLRLSLKYGADFPSFSDLEGPEQILSYIEEMSYFIFPPVQPDKLTFNYPYRPKLK